MTWGMSHHSPLSQRSHARVTKARYSGAELSFDRTCYWIRAKSGWSPIALEPLIWLLALKYWCTPDCFEQKDFHISRSFHANFTPQKISKIWRKWSGGTWLPRERPGRPIQSACPSPLPVAPLVVHRSSIGRPLVVRSLKLVVKVTDTTKTDKRASHGGVQTSGCPLNYDTRLRKTCVLSREHSQEV